MAKIDMRALSKTLSQIEEGGESVLSVLKELYSKKRGVPIIGVTGLPGAGKSTLVDQLIEHLRKTGNTVGVLAIDPSSPFSGGAVLGDRIRMQRHAADDGVFIRSIGSRGAHGGLSRATRHLSLCLDAFGFDEIIIETVGVGQTELDIMGLALTTIVIVVPESGDAVQTLKAGLNEIADIFVVNKADRGGAEQLQTLLKTICEHPTLQTQANQGIGISDLLGEILSHRQQSQRDPQHTAHQQQIRRAQFLEFVGDVYKEKIIRELTTRKKWQKLLDQVAQETINPYEALEGVRSSLSTV